MRGVWTQQTIVFVIAGLAIAASLSLVPFVVRPAAAQPISLWEAAGRGLVTITMVDLTVHEPSGDAQQPAGIKVVNLGTQDILVTDFPVLMSPSPDQSPAPAPQDTTQDAVLENATVPAGGSVTFVYAQFVLAGWLADGPRWWCLEEIQFTKSGIPFTVGGQTLPFAMRAMIEHPTFTSMDDNTQTALYAYLRQHPAVVVEKQPLWSSLNDNAGQTVRITDRATNLAVWAYDDAYTVDVNATGTVLSDTVPAGWSVQAGSYTVNPDSTTTNGDGSQTLTWKVDLPAAQVSTDLNPAYPTPFETKSISYTLVTPALTQTSLALPRATVDVNGDGTADAESAPPTLAVTLSAQAPVADAGGPYSGKEGDTILLNASKSSDPNGDALQYRWSFTDNGTFDTPWSSSPTAEARYTDEFTGQVRVEVSDGHATDNATASVTIANVPPTIVGLTASAEASFTLRLAGERWHDATLTVHGNGTDLATVRVLRQPGNPAAQSKSTGSLAFDLSKPVGFTVSYTPQDDAVNGQPLGDNPAWVVISWADGSRVTLFHNLNVARGSTWTWTDNRVGPLLLAHGLTFQAALHDPGSDGLTAHWDFGDGTNLTQSYPNGNSTESPEGGGVSPFDVTATAVHAYAAAGTYHVVLTVDDPDGGQATATLDVTWS